MPENILQAKLTELIGLSQNGEVTDADFAAAEKYHAAIVAAMADPGE